MITELTKEQQAKFPIYVNKWQAIGLSTAPCDVEESKKAIKLAYKLAGIKPPTRFYGPFNCPIEAAIAHILIEHNPKKRPATINKAIEAVANTLMSGGTVKRIFASFSGEIKSGLDSLEVDALEQIVQETIRPMKLALPTGQITRENLHSKINQQAYGNQDGSWLSSYDFIFTELGIKPNRLEGLIKLAHHCGWWTPLENVCLLQHRPKEIHFNAQQRLHNTEGPAIGFRGVGLSNVYAMEGTRLSRAIIERGFTIYDIDHQTNAEIRRYMIDLYGPKNYVLDSGIKECHRDDYGVLYKKEVPGDEAIVVVKVYNTTKLPDGTQREYYLRVNPEAYGGINTARAAIASTWRRKDGSLVFPTPDDYVLSVES